MKRRIVVLAGALAGLGAFLSGPATAVEGEATEFPSPNGLTEQCVRIAPFPGADYAKKDRETEAAYCAIDLHASALCPKLWSTSPGTIVFEIDATGDEAIAAWERANCSDGHHAKQAAKRQLATYKMSVNDRKTSATWAPSSWVYYHLSRYFDTHVAVPVAVYRSMDAASHNDRVTRPALGIVGDRRNLRMLAAGWRFMEAVETGGDAPSGARGGALTDDGRQVYGVLLDNKGDRYGPEFNGTRASGWGNGQNEDFQHTAAFLALRDPSPVAEAAAASIRAARRDPAMAKALRADTPVEQVLSWMQDVMEITLLDYMLGQQDRIGNIDYTWRWFWLEDGELKSKAAHGREAPAEIASFEPWRLRRSAINDNDAGVRPGYANFAKRTGMLDGFHHYDPVLYQRLGRFAEDLASEGPMYQWLTGAAGLGSREAGNIAIRAGEAFGILQAACRSGEMKLDFHLPSALGGRPLPAEQDTGCEIAKP